MASIFEKWNKSIDLQGLKNDIESASQNNNGNYVEVPVGNYEVKITKAEVKATKNGDPMVSIWFKILEGDYKDRLIFMNQVITQGFQLKIVNEFLRSLETGLSIEFIDYEQYNDLLMDVCEAIEEQKLEYLLEYGENKGFNTFKISEIFEA